MSIALNNSILIAIAFLVPGFVLASILDMTFRRRSRRTNEVLLQYLTFSCINYALWSWLVILIFQVPWIRNGWFVLALLVFWILFGAPAVLGLLIVGFSKKPKVQQFLSALGFKVQRFIPTAWDFQFQKEDLCWILVRLIDGSHICGFFGSRSFAGDDPDERDLYIERIFTLSEDGEWRPDVEESGILVKANQIATVEFRPITVQRSGS